MYYYIIIIIIYNYSCIVYTFGWNRPGGRADGQAGGRTGGRKAGRVDKGVFWSASTDLYRQNGKVAPETCNGYDSLYLTVT